MSLTIKLPVKNKSEYSLYVSGDISYLKKVKDLGTLLIASGCGVAFFTSTNARRAIIFAEMNENDFNIPVEKGHIPYFLQPVKVLYKATGRRFDLVKYICFNLEKDFKKKIYRLGIPYWITLSSFIDSLKGSHITKKMYRRQTEAITEKYILLKELRDEDL